LVVIATWMQWIICGKKEVLEVHRCSRLAQTEVAFGGHAVQIERILAQHSL
jgi:hypothetical protein